MRVFSEFFKKIKKIINELNDSSIIYKGQNIYNRNFIILKIEAEVTAINFLIFFKHY